MKDVKNIKELKKIIDELESSEEKYRNLYENSVVAMFTTDMKTRKTIAVNDKGVELFGYSSKESFLENFNAVSHFIEPQEREKNIQSIEQKGEVRNSEQEMKKLDGTIFWVKIFLKINTEMSIVQTVLIDITEQKKLEGEKKAYIASLEELLFMTSHKVRKPVSYFIGLMNMVETDVPLTQEELKGILDHLKSSVLELDEFTQELTTHIYNMKEKESKRG